jgi:Skp family chaperone for outer membrane proteins
MRRILGIALLAGLLGSPALAGGATSVQVNATIIDVQRILQESLAAKSAQQQLESQRAKFQTEIASEEDELRKAEDELTKSRDTLASDVYADREQQLRQRFLVVERHVQARRKALDQAFTDAMNKVRDGLQDVVGALAHERHLSLVLVKQQALWSDKSLDVTDEVLARLNKSLPSVSVTVSPEAIENAGKDVVFRSNKKVDEPVKKAPVKR